MRQCVGVALGRVALRNRPGAIAAELRGEGLRAGLECRLVLGRCEMPGRAVPGRGVVGRTLRGLAGLEVGDGIVAVERELGPELGEHRRLAGTAARRTTWWLARMTRPRAQQADQQRAARVRVGLVIRRLLGSPSNLGDRADRLSTRIASGLSRSCQRAVGRRERKKSPGIVPGLLRLPWRRDLEVHAAHATHSAHAAAPASAGAGLLRTLGDHRLGGDQQAGDRGRILQRAAHDLGRVDHALRRRDRRTRRSARCSRRCTCCSPGSCRPRRSRPRRRSARSGAPAPAAPCARCRCRSSGRRSRSCSFSSALMARSSATPPPGTMPSSTAARVACSASSTRSLRSFTSISVAPPTLITATPPASLASRSCSFSLVVVGGRLLDLRLDLLDAALDVGLLAGAVDDGRVVLVDRHLLGAAQHVERDVLELDAEVLADHLAAGEDGDVLQHGLAAIAEARRLDGRDLEAAAQLVDDERRQRLALDLLGDDQQRLAGLHHRLEQRQHRLQAGELLLVDEDVGALELDQSSCRRW